MLPLSLMSIIGYQSIKEDLYHSTINLLITDVEEQHLFLSGWFERHYLNLLFYTENIQNIQFLEVLQHEFKKSNQSLNAFTNSNRWSVINKRLQGDINRFLTTYEYYDVFLIDTQGNILFTLKRESDLGTNLFNGPYANTRFSAAARKTLQTGESTFSDLEHYAPSDGKVAGFFINVMHNEDGEKIGLFAFQITPEQVQSGLHQKQHGNLQSYIVGYSDTDKSYTLRTPLVFNNPNQSSAQPSSNYIGRSIKTAQVNLITSEYESGTLDEPKNGTNGFIYLNHEGHSVLGVHRNVLFGSINWSIITELPEDIAFSAIQSLEEKMAWLVLLLMILIIILAVGLTRSFMKPILELTTVLTRVSKGDLQVHISSTAKHEVGSLINDFNQMIDALKLSTETSAKQKWKSIGITEFHDATRGLVDIRELGSVVCSNLAKYLNVPIMTFYVAANDELEIVGSYALSTDKHFVNRIKFGEGIVGQAACENEPISVSDIPEHYTRISSSIGNASPRHIVAIPFSVGNNVQGVIEIGSFHELNIVELELLATLKEPMGLTIRSIFEQFKTKGLLEETKRQSEELCASNENLEEQTQRLKQSEEELKQQGEELKASNEELESKQIILSEQKDEVEAKAAELTLASKYKSEFLANMSHELRTPLNSLLLLSNSLSNNKEGNLTEAQVQSAKYINEGGKDLLTLINDILDLSKVEAGMLSVNAEEVELPSIVTSMANLFELTGQEKGVLFKTTIAENVPASFTSDSQRLQQILKNFLSNAFKFTEVGMVSLNIHLPVQGMQFANSLLNSDNAIVFAVSDTGIGIPEDKQRAVFEAFRQEDGSTSRKYGGTGLGLSISSQLTNLLGGELQLVSKKNKGSTFSLCLPLVYEGKIENGTKAVSIVIPDSLTPIAENINKEENTINYGNISSIEDDRRTIVDGDNTMLIIEDDEVLATSLVAIIKENGFKVLVANEGRDGIYLAIEYQPRGILLDIGLPDVNGMEVLEQLKHNLKTRHIPIHMLSGVDLVLPALNMGAIGYLKKPATHKQLVDVLSKVTLLNTKDKNKILVVEDKAATRAAIKSLFDSQEVELFFVNDGFAACEAIRADVFDCMILDLGLQGKDGFAVIEELNRDASVHLPPIIIYTAQELTDSEYMHLKEFGAKIVIKGADSPEHLLNDVSLFLHMAQERLSKQQKQSINMLHDENFMLRGRNILLVDDDMRNTFALSTQLTEQGMIVSMANNGQVALDKMEEETFDLILMDIMMPIMDGYEAMKRIRQSQRYSDIPIIALTAKAMPEDRDKCLCAGASEFLNKPIDFEKLLSMLRVWLYRRE